MASNKKSLKAYVRFDGSGRVVAGSLILRKNKPKVGKWKEIQAYECCFLTTTTTTTCINFNYRIIITAEDLLDATGNTGVQALGPNGQTYTTVNGDSYHEEIACNSSSGGGGNSVYDMVVCASQPPYLWYFKNDQYVLVDAVTNLGTPC